MGIIKATFNALGGSLADSWLEVIEADAMSDTTVLTKGVKVQFVEGKVVVDTILTVSYGSNVVKVARQVQEKVLAAVQATTGLEQVEVNVHVTGIAFEK